MASPFSMLTSALTSAQGKDIIDIREEKGAMVVVCRKGDQRLTTFVKRASRHLFGYRRMKAGRDEESTTIAYCQKLFGKARLVRLARRARVHLSKGVLRKKELERLIVGACEVYEEDLNELLREINASLARTIRHLTEEETSQLRMACKDIESIDNSSRTVLDLLFHALVPPGTIDEIFLGNPPSADDPSFDSGKDFVGRRQRVLFYERMRRSPPDEATWAMYMGKRLVDREIPKGVVFRNGHGGYGKVHAVVHGGGAYKLFITQIDSESKCYENVVVYRGARLVPSATGWWRTGLDGIRIKLGAQGSKATAEETKALLSDPQNGFIADPHERVTGVGMSLGGTHLMRDAALFADHFRKIVVLAAPGIDMATAKLFASKGGMHEIEHWWEVDDFCDQLGEAHLGMGCDPSRARVTVMLLIPDVKKRSLEQLAQERPRFPGELRDTSALRKGATTAGKILIGPHCRLTLCEPHSCLVLSSQKDPALVQRVLAHDPLLCDVKWEQARLLLAKKGFFLNMHKS